MRRIVSVWLPRWPTDRYCRDLQLQALSLKDMSCPEAKQARTRHAQLQADPLVLIREDHGGVRVTAVNRAAAQAGLTQGMRLTDARAMLPGIQVHEADLRRDRISLKKLADWCGRYSPWTCPESEDPDEDGIFIDITGADHLFGGEQALLDDLVRRLSGFGVTARAAVADTPGAAHALARYGGLPAQMTIICPLNHARRALQFLPLGALRLDRQVIEGLDRLGLRRIGDLYGMERAPLSLRFGGMVLGQMDKALGKVSEPISPSLPVAPYRARISFADPIGLVDDVKRAIDTLSADLCGLLEKDGKGARKLELALYRVDGKVSRLSVGAAQPSCEADHLARLFADKLDRLGDDFDAGFGIEVISLAALVAERITSHQQALPEKQTAPARKLMGKRVPIDLGHLVDRLGNRLGLENVAQMEPRASHIPELAVVLSPMDAVSVATARPREPHDWRVEQAQLQGQAQSRPLHMLPCPEPVEVIAEVPDGPPVRFRWRRVPYQVAKAEGPERIAPEWWKSGGKGQNRLDRTRDYYRVEDDEGRRFWLYRDGLYGEQGDLFSDGVETGPPPAPRWYMHGVFA